MRLHRKIEGKIKRTTITKYPSGKYYVSFIVENEQPIINKKVKNKEIGIDLGIENFAITSNNEIFSNPKYLKKYKKQLIKAQRILSRKKKGSKGFESQKIKVAKIHEKISNCREDMQHKVSYLLTNKYRVIYLEDLDVKGMMAKHHLAEEIADCAWNSFISKLQYKGSWYNCEIRKINRWYPSSKTCSSCGYINESLQLKDRKWICPKCGKEHNRDVNAAINILKEGQIEYKSLGTSDDANGENVSLKRSKKSNKQISLKLEANKL